MMKINMLKQLSMCSAEFEPRHNDKTKGIRSERNKFVSEAAYMQSRHPHE